MSTAVCIYVAGLCASCRLCVIYVRGDNGSGISVMITQLMAHRDLNVGERPSI